MKLFKNEDVETRTEYPRIYARVEDLGESLLPWQRLGLQYTASGYGKKIPSPYKINFAGKLYRIYTTIFGGAGSSWFTAKGRKIYVD